jgi:exopolysaccharide production protein ExoQ
MFYLMVVPADFDYGSAAVDTSGNPTTRAMLTAILLSGLIVVVGRSMAAWRVIRAVNPFFWLLIGMAALSLVWSIDPGLTARRMYRMLVECSAALVLAVAAWERQRFQHVVRPAITALLLGSIVFGLARPDLAIHQGTSPELFNSWHGLATQKNLFGALASFGVILWLHAWMSRTSSKLSVLVGGAASVACLILSRSSTSIIATIFACCVMVLMLRAPGSMRRSLPFAVMFIIVAVTLYALAMLKVVPGLEILLAPIPMITGKDLTFSGRSEIWSAIVSHIQIRPLAGSGYGAYWSGPLPGTESFGLKFVLNGFYPGSAHNGYLEILNDLGAIGALVLLGYILRYSWDAMALYRFDRAQSALYVALFLQQAIGNLSESSWFNVTEVQFVVLTMATFCLARSLHEARRAAKSAKADGAF